MINEEKYSVTKKDTTISKIRFIATSMVVLLHILQRLGQSYSYLNYFSDWLNLGLVLFFVISGFLYSNREIKKTNMGGWLVHRYTELAIPSILVTIVTLIIYSILIGNISSENIIYSILSALGFEAFLPDGWIFIQLWFLTYILICYITVPIIQKINIVQMSEVAFWGMIICTTVILQGMGSAISVITSFTTLSWGVLLRFYLAYMIFKRYSIKGKKCRRYMTIMTMVTLPMIVGICYVRYIWIPQGIIKMLSELAYIYIQTIAGVELFYWLYLILDHVKISDTFLKISDKYSYAVYLTHCLFIGYSTSLIYRCSNIYIGILTALICTGISSFFVGKISELIKKKLKN